MRYLCVPIPLLCVICVFPYHCCALSVCSHTTVVRYLCVPIPLLCVICVFPYHCCALSVCSHTTVVRYLCVPLPLLCVICVFPYHCCALFVCSHTTVVRYLCVPIPLLCVICVFPYRRPLSFLLSTDVYGVFNLPNDPCACFTHNDETRTEGCRLGRTGKRFFALSRPGVEPRALDLKSCALASQRRPESVYIYVASQEYGLYLHCEATLQNTRLVGTVFICTKKLHCKTRVWSVFALRSYI